MSSMTQDMLTEKTKPSIWSAMSKGLKLRCPNCGTGKLFRAYLKPVAQCRDCGHDWENVRADDGPAWATMLIVGHLVGPIAVAMILNPILPLWASLIALPLVTLALCLALLPSMKGAFIGIIWVTGAPTS